MSQSGRAVLVDGNNLIHRAAAIFANGPDGSPLMSPSGYPTGLVFGSLSMLSDWVQDVSNPTRMDVFLDGSPRRRLALDPSYKQQERTKRPGSDPMVVRLCDGFEAANELEVLVHLLRLLGSDIYHGPDEEADDLIASYVMANPDSVHVIMSSDRDFYELLSMTDRAILYRPGIPGNRFFDAERAADDMIKKYGVHVPPANIRMFKALTGDSSDGIVGVPRLRKKVAAPLCSCRSVDEVYATGLPNFSKAEKEKAVALQGRIALNYDLVGLFHDVDFTRHLRPATPDFDLAARILRDDLGIRSISPHVFRFGPQKVRFGDGHDFLPDFLRDI